MLIHQPHGGASGQAVDIEIQAKEIMRMRELLDEILAFHTGQPLERVDEGHRPRLHHERRSRPKDYGIVDEVLTNRELAAVPSAAEHGLSSGSVEGRGGVGGEVR